MQRFESLMKAHRMPPDVAFWATSTVMEILDYIEGFRFSEHKLEKAGIIDSGGKCRVLLGRPLAF